MCVCVFVCVCVNARACTRICVCMCMRLHVCEREREYRLSSAFAAGKQEPVVREMNSPVTGRTYLEYNFRRAGASISCGMFLEPTLLRICCRRKTMA